MLSKNNAKRKSAVAKSAQIMDKKIYFAYLQHIVMIMHYLVLHNATAFINYVPVASLQEVILNF
jgi:hypothetical protein